MTHSWIPRIEAEAMPVPLANYLAPRIQRLGYVGEMFKVAANVPDVLLAYSRFTDALKEALAFDIAETVVLTVATLMNNRYERHQHERLCIRHGLSRDWVAQVQTLEPQAAVLMTPAQRAAQEFVVNLERKRGLQVGGEFDALSAHFSAAEAVAITFLVGRYVTHALLVNTLELDPPVPSIFEDGFAP